MFPISLVYPPPRKRTGKMVLIKMHTDEGIVGVAEGGDLMNIAYDQDIVMLMLKNWEPVLIGANPFDKELILAKINTFINNVTGGLSFPNVVALVDFALWDW